ncbi:MAG: DUF2071 domain-containing protein [Bacteroidota bacterium]
MKPFLTAHWANLLNITYQVPPDLLQPHVPDGVELDVQDGHAFASIVAFDFLNTRVKGIKVPFHVNFPEINLRFYVKYKGERGVVFIKELVPRYCIALVANRIYNEPYESCPMESQTLAEGGTLNIEHRFKYGEKNHQIKATAHSTLSTPVADSIIHYFKEHKWGFGKTHSGKTLRYEVQHPIWEVYDLTSWNLEMDFGEIYGPNWAFLGDAEPYAACLAKGSDVAVYPYGAV